MTFKKTIFAGLLTLLPMTATAGDWTGFYGGLSFGAGDLTTNTGNTAKQDGFGLHVGYLHDFGDVVVGGELEHSQVDFGNPLGAFSGHTTRVKARVGYDAGDWMPYAFVGTGRASFATISDNLTNYGLGVDYMINSRVRIGAEYMIEKSDSDFGGTGNSVDIDTFQVRIGLKF